MLLLLKLKKNILLNLLILLNKRQLERKYNKKLIQIRELKYKFLELSK